MHNKVDVNRRADTFGLAEPNFTRLRDTFIRTKTLGTSRVQNSIRIKINFKLKFT